jgi:hypothetical protein
VGVLRVDRLLGVFDLLSPHHHSPSLPNLHPTFTQHSHDLRFHSAPKHATGSNKELSVIAKELSVSIITKDQVVETALSTTGIPWLFFRIINLSFST